jgi:hypothetical protein
VTTIEHSVQRACGPSADAADGWICRPWDCSRAEECPLPDVENVYVGAEYLPTLLAAEGEEQCGASCACHGAVVCARRPGPEADEPHIGRDECGEIVQWVHNEDEHGPMKSMDDVASEAAAAKRAATYALLDGLDVEVLRNITAPKIAGADGERSGR